jgi:hypothetical protein
MRGLLDYAIDEFKELYSTIKADEEILLQKLKAKFDLEKYKL